MSKLSDLIRRATRAEPAPLGFGSSRGAAAPTMVLVALVGQRWKQGVAEAVAAGAAALLLTGHPNEKDMSEAVSAAEKRPCGLLAPDADQLPALRDAGIDFVVLATDAPARALQDEALTFLLQVREDLTDIQLRTLEALPLDALFVEPKAAPLTIARQMELQRLSGLTRSPLLLPAPPDAEKDDLLSLREAGVALIAVDLDDRDAARTLQRLRALIDALPDRRALRRGERREVTLPTVAGEPEEVDEEEE